MNDLKKDVAAMMAQVTDAYHQLGTLAAQTDPEKIQRTLERVSSQTERAALGVRKLCEKHSPGVGGYGSRPVLPRMETAGFVETLGYGWLHIQLNTLLPHCRYQISDWLSDTIRRLLDEYEAGGSKLPFFKRAMLVIDEHCGVKGRHVFDQDNGTRERPAGGPGPQWDWDAAGRGVVVMLLSVQQKYILDALRKLGVVRKDQLHALVRGKFQRPGFEVSAARMEAMLRQLRAGLGEFRADGDFVYLARGQPDALRLEAIDVMLELSEGAPQDFSMGLDSPRLLRFAIGGDKLRLFSVACLSGAADLRLIQREKLERIVWISDSGTLPEQLTLPPKHFFAARQEDGSHCFYGSNGL